MRCPVCGANQNSNVCCGCTITESAIVSDEYAKCAECEKQSDKLAKYEKALVKIKDLSTSLAVSELTIEADEIFSECYVTADQALADETKEVE